MEKIKVKLVQMIAAYVNGDGDFLEEFETIEEGIEKYKEELTEGVAVGHVWRFSTEDNNFIDDSRGCYTSELEALVHFQELKFSHSSEATDTEGHSYDCNHCGIYYTIWSDDIPLCKVEKVMTN